MDIGNVMDELGAAVDTIAGVRVFPYWADKVTPPAAIVSWPDIDFDTTYARGADRLTVPLWLVVGKVVARTARNDLAKYLAGAGASSVKAVIEAHSTAVWHSVRVTKATVTVIPVAGNDYLGAEFEVDIIGSGS